MARSPKNKPKGIVNNKRPRSDSAVQQTSEPKRSRPTSEVDDEDQAMQVDDSEDELALPLGGHCMYYYNVINIYIYYNYLDEVKATPMEEDDDDEEKQKTPKKKGMCSIIFLIFHNS